jgi:hypothetical protein
VTRLLSGPAVFRLLSGPAVFRLLSGPAVTRLLSDPMLFRLLSKPVVTRLLSGPAVTRLLFGPAVTRLLSGTKVRRCRGCEILWTPSMFSRSYVFIQQLSGLHIKSLGVVDNRISRLIPPKKNLAQEKRGGGEG